MVELTLHEKATKNTAPRSTRSSCLWVFDPRLTGSYLGFFHAGFL